MNDAINKILIGGDLASLNAQEKADYYQQVCASLGLNPLTQPLAYITLNGKLRLYALRDCAEQLRKIHSVSITRMDRETVGEICLITVHAKDAQGREDISTGAVALGNLKGEALANAYLKGETKAKRRVTLSICGLGMLDETEVDTLDEAATRPARAKAQPSPATGEGPAAEDVEKSAAADQSSLNQPVAEPTQGDPPPTKGEAPAVPSARAATASSSAASPASSASADKPLGRQEAIFKIQTRLHELVGGKSDATARQEKMDLCREVFGTSIDTWARVTQLPLTSLRKGAQRLMDMRREVPPDGASPDADDGFGEPPAQPPVAHDEEAIMPPEEPTITAEGYVHMGDIEALRLWAEMVGVGEALTDILRTCPRQDDGRLFVTPIMYARARDAIAWAQAHHASTGAAPAAAEQEVPMA